MLTDRKTPWAPWIHKRVFAKDVVVDTSNFNHQLSDKDTDVLKALNTIDNTVSVNRTFIDSTEQFTIWINKQMINCDKLEILWSLVIDGWLCFT